MTDTPNGGHTPPGGYAAYLTGRLAALGLSRNALARALGHKGASQVSRWCAGKSVPREKARTKIEAALGKADYLAGVDSGWGAGLPPYIPPETPQDAPGTTICGGEAPEGTPFVVERYVVEGG